jgi:hypothetical protein
VVLGPGQSRTETLSGLSKTNTMVVEGFGTARTSAVVAVIGRDAATRRTGFGYRSASTVAPPLVASDDTITPFPAGTRCLA